MLCVDMSCMTSVHTKASFFKHREKVKSGKRKARRANHFRTTGMLPYKWKRMGEIDQMGIALAVRWAVNLVYGNMSRFDNVSPCKAMGEWSGHSTLIHG